MVKAKKVTKERELFIINNIKYDPETGVLTWKNNMANNSIPAGTKAGTIYNKGYIRIKCLDRLILGHRIAWFLYYGEWPKGCIDHKSQVRTDNRIINLRDVSVLTNRKNGSLQSNNTTGINGVTRQYNCKWRVRINTEGKRINLGLFDDFFEACCVRKAAELKYNYHPNHGKSDR